MPRLPEEQWLWPPVWRQTAAPAPAARQPAPGWSTPTAAAADQVLDELRRTPAGDGVAVTAVRPGAAYGADRAAGYTVRPGNAGDAQSMLRDLRQRGLALERVVHLWTLPERPGGTDEAVSLGLHSLVALARAAGEVGSGDWALDLVTAGAHQVLEGAEVRPDAATLIGPLLVVIRWSTPTSAPACSTSSPAPPRSGRRRGTAPSAHRPAVALRGTAAAGCATTTPCRRWTGQARRCSVTAAST